MCVIPLCLYIIFMNNYPFFQLSLFLYTYDEGKWGDLVAAVADGAVDLQRGAFILLCLD